MKNLSCQVFNFIRNKKISYWLPLVLWLHIFLCRHLYQVDDYNVYHSSNLTNTIGRGGEHNRTCVLVVRQKEEKNWFEQVLKMHKPLLHCHPKFFISLSSTQQPKVISQVEKYRGVRICPPPPPPPPPLPPPHPTPPIYANDSYSSNSLDVYQKVSILERTRDIFKLFSTGPPGKC